MLIRFLAENIASFKDAVEFNTLPSSKSHNHDNHKLVCGHATVLRLSAIYGANGAGKSNLLILINLLKGMVEEESLRNISVYEDFRFRFDPDCADKPSSLAVEFFSKGSIFYYHVEFDKDKFYSEELLLSKKTTDAKIFSRDAKGISLWGDYMKKGASAQFIDALDRLVRPDMLLLSFLGQYYPTEIPLVRDAYEWFTDSLQVVLPETTAGIVPQMFDSNPEFAALVNSMLPEMSTGISRIEVKKEAINEEDAKGNIELMRLVKQAKEKPGEPVVRTDDGTGEVYNIVVEDGKVYSKSLTAIHRQWDGTESEMPMPMESDGTRRMVEYMPIFYTVLNENAVFVVDEIERSIHPILIKDIMRKLSESQTAKGQLIFTTHESGLLDQSIFRPDEIWLAQKDVEQATQLYPLSDYNIHKTANIENGYLDGRYGGIPFLSNLKDLHW